MTQDHPSPNPDSILARGGGNATAAGVSFQAKLGALFAAQMLAERQVDRRLHPDARIVSLRFETEAPVDDLLIETDAGWIFVQAKTNLSLAAGKDSELGKTAEQIVRQWLSCSSGDATRGWNRPLNSLNDRILLAVGTGSPRTVSDDLAQALTSQQAPGAAPMPDGLRQALDVFTRLLESSWQKITGSAATPQDIQPLLTLVTILTFDLDGADQTAAIEILAHTLIDTSQSAAAFATIAQRCAELAKARQGTNSSELKRTLAATDIRFAAPPSYRKDVDQLIAYSELVHEQLEQYEETKIAGKTITVERPCTQAVVDAAVQGSLLLVGDPGAGKSAVIQAAASKLRSQGFDVIELAVDRLQTATLEGLTQQLGLTHPLRDVLANWPGDKPAFLLIDALDATRGGPSEAVFRTLIADALSLNDSRWRVVASIRTFDLRLGEQFRQLFRGQAPNDAFADGAFSDVRHIHVPSWSPQELQELLARAPELATAVGAGGDRLLALALVPFNTRLLADLISGGLAPEAFSELQTQVQLLELYWRHRIAKHGAGAELCLRVAVAEMIKSRSLRAPKLEAAKHDPNAFDQLLRENVLVTAGNQHVAFRHHILFDYATSRLYLAPDDLEATAKLVDQGNGLGLMLAPALAFALQQLWSDQTQGHRCFWQAVARIAGDPGCDPVARSVAARTASELPKIAGDIAGLIHGLTTQGQEKSRTVTALSHIVGSLVVRVEDKQPVVLAPWSSFASDAAAHIQDTVWSLRTLLFILVAKISTEDERAQLGRAARAVLIYALASPKTSSQLASAAIEFVADTYASDIVASRALLRALFEPEHFNARGDQEIPWLAGKVKSIASVDPDFVVEIYRGVFGGQITDDSSTSLGRSQILPLTSNRRQDYDMAQWSLGEFFPVFFKSNPIHATTALVCAISAYVAIKHPVAEAARRWAIPTSAGDVRLTEDQSHIWAWNFDEKHGDNALGMLKAFMTGLQSADPIIARAVTEVVRAQNDLAVIWSRILFVAAKRPDVLGDLLWPIATQHPFLTCLDTLKDANDLIAARYPLQTISDREELERRALTFDFSTFNNPERARRTVLGTLFGCIGRDNLVSAEAVQFLSGDAASPAVRANRRPFEITSGSSDPEPYWWLTRNGVDIASPDNARLLAAMESVKSSLDSEKREGPVGELPAAIAMIAQLMDDVDAASGDVSNDVAEAVMGVAAQGAAKVARLPVPQLKQDNAVLGNLIDLVLRLIAFRVEDVGPDVEAQFEKSAAWGSPAPRVDAAEAAMHLCRCDAAIVDRLRPAIEGLLADNNPAVRLQIAERLTTLWETARPLMWQLAETVIARENNRGVLRFFANYFLGRVVHADSENVERLTFALRERVTDRSDPRSEDLLEEIGSLVGLLWVSHGREQSRKALETWLSDAPSYEPELSHAIGVIRGALVLKYEEDTPKNIALTRRAQELAAWTVETTAAGLQSYLRSSTSAPPSESEQQRGTLFAKLLNQVCNEFYFSSGVFRHGQNEPPALEVFSAKRGFLDDTHAILLRIADAGTPGTIHHLIELLEFLIPADPERVFDLVAHALLGAGKQHGYQFESLGADRFVSVIGRYLADYRGIFNDEGRRKTLVACLDAFMEAGWPAARRLLYRLPELLQ